MKKTKFVLVGLLIFVMVFAIAGCRVPQQQPAPSPAPGPNVPPDQTPDPAVPPTDPNWNQPGVTPGDPMNPNITPGPPTPAPGPQPAPSPAPAPAPGPGARPGAAGNANNAAERIANMVTEMENVERATAVVMGNMAIIGVRVEGGNNQRAQNRDNAAGQEMKQEIAQKVEREMPEIGEAIVTADPEITEKIENISRNVAQGRPLSESFDEIAQIVRDMAPRRGRN